MQNIKKLCSSTFNIQKLNTSAEKKAFSVIEINANRILKNTLGVLR